MVLCNKNISIPVCKQRTESDSRVSAEIEKELEEGEADDEGRLRERVEATSEDSNYARCQYRHKRRQRGLTEETSEEEALDLNPPAADVLNREDGDPVTCMT